MYSFILVQIFWYLRILIFWCGRLSMHPHIYRHKNKPIRKKSKSENWILLTCLNESCGSYKLVHDITQNEKSLASTKYSIGKWRIMNSFTSRSDSVHILRLVLGFKNGKSYLKGQFRQIIVLLTGLSRQITCYLKGSYYQWSFSIYFQEKFITKVNSQIFDSTTVLF